MDILKGDYSKAKEKLGRKPKTAFNELVRLMEKSDYEKLKVKNESNSNI